MEWRVLYPNAMAFALPAIGSDHSPIILSLHQKEKKSKKMFRFELVWLEDPECEEVIKKVWLTNRSTEKSLTKKKISLVAEELHRWRRKKFQNAQKQITPLKSRLVEITNTTNGDQSR